MGFPQNGLANHCCSKIYEEGQAKKGQRLITATSKKKVWPVLNTENQAQTFILLYSKHVQPRETGTIS